MQEILQALTWTFLHSLWQGLIAALVAAVIISTTRYSTARLRYNLLGAVMIIFLCASSLTFILQLSSGINPSPASSTFAVGVENTTADTHPFMDNFIAWVNNNSSLLLLTWFLFFAISLFRLTAGLASINRLRKSRLEPVPLNWKTKLQQLQNQMGIYYKVPLLQSSLIKIPLTLGVFKPIILIPVGLLVQLPAQQIEAILLHELAHVRRRDYLINLLQHIAVAVFFFNPGLRWLSALIKQEREACCDDLVISKGSQKNNYINALVSFQEFSVAHGSFAMALHGNNFHLLSRVKRLLTSRNNGISFFELVTLVSGFLLFSAFGVFVKVKNDMQVGEMIDQPLITASIRFSNAPLRLPKELKRESARINKHPIDTLPGKKQNKPVSPVYAKPVNTDTTIHKPSADDKLKEIIQLKDEIGQNKLGIGIKKEQLNNANEASKKEINLLIEQDRKKLEDQREQLNQSRKEWDELKKKELKKTVADKVSAAISGNAENNSSSEISVTNKIASSINQTEFKQQEFEYKIKGPSKISPPEKKFAPVELKPPNPPDKKLRKDITNI